MENGTNRACSGRLLPSGSTSGIATSAPAAKAYDSSFSQRPSASATSLTKLGRLAGERVR